MFFVLVLAGAAVGLSLSLFGAGGTVLALPLFLALGIAPKLAIAMALGAGAIAALMGAGAAGASGGIDWRRVAIPGLPAAAGAWLGARLTEGILSEWLLLLFGALVLGSGLVAWRGRDADPGRRREPGLALSASLGGVVGALTGAVGAGALLVLPALNPFPSTPRSSWVGTSLSVIALQSTAGLMGYLSYLPVPAGVAVPLALGVAVGAGASLRVPVLGSIQSTRWRYAALACLVAVWLAAMLGARMVGLERALREPSTWGGDPGSTSLAVPVPPGSVAAWLENRQGDDGTS